MYIWEWKWDWPNASFILMSLFPSYSTCHANELKPLREMTLDPWDLNPKWKSRAPNLRVKIALDKLSLSSQLRCNFIVTFLSYRSGDSKIYNHSLSLYLFNIKNEKEEDEDLEMLAFSLLAGEGELGRRRLEDFNSHYAICKLDDLEQEELKKNETFIDWDPNMNFCENKYRFERHNEFFLAI